MARLHLCDQIIEAASGVEFDRDAPESENLRKARLVLLEDMMKSGDVLVSYLLHGAFAAIKGLQNGFRFSCLKGFGQAGDLAPTTRINLTQRGIRFDHEERFAANRRSGCRWRC